MDKNLALRAKGRQFKSVSDHHQIGSENGNHLRLMTTSLEITRRYPKKGETGVVGFACLFYLFLSNITAAATTTMMTTATPT
jgi:hypothetical protein